MKNLTFLKLFFLAHLTNKATSIRGNYQRKSEACLLLCVNRLDVYCYSAHHCTVLTIIY